jgi:hypothetical protein
MGLNDFIKRLLGNAGPSAQAAARAEIMELAGQMTEFDRQTGALCAQTWRDRGSSDDIVYGGMLRVLKAACEGGLDENVSPRELLDAKSAESARSREWARYCEGVALGIAKGWPEIECGSHGVDMPAIVHVMSAVVAMHEKKNRRPRGEALRGHYAVLADFVFAVGLALAVHQPSIAQRLAVEPFIPF